MQDLLPSPRILYDIAIFQKVVYSTLNLFLKIVFVLLIFNILKLLHFNNIYCRTSFLVVVVVRFSSGVRLEAFSTIP
jgi:hypothetical protein